MSSNTCSRQLSVLMADACRRNVKFAHELRIKGLVGIMADQREVSWVDLNETFVNVANSVGVGLENARQPLNNGMQSPPQNMIKEAQISRPHPPLVGRCLLSPVQHHDPPRFDLSQAAVRPRMLSPGVPNVPQMRRPLVKLQRLPSRPIVSPGSVAVIGTERQTSALEDMSPKTSKFNGSVLSPEFNGSDLSPKKMEKREELERVNGDEDKSNGNKNQKRSKEGNGKSPVKVKNLKSLKRANEEPFETFDESPEKNWAMKTGKKKTAKKNAIEMPELIREAEADDTWRDEPPLSGKGADEQGTRKTKPKPQVKRSKLETE